MNLREVSSEIWTVIECVHWIHRKHLIELFPRFPLVNIIAGEWYRKYQCEHSSDIRCFLYTATRKVRSAEIQVDTVVNWARPAKFILRVFWLSVFVLINCIVVCHLHWLYLAIKCDFVEFTALYLQLLKYWWHKIPPDGVANTSIWFNNFDKGEIRPSYYERSLHRARWYSSPSTIWTTIWATWTIKYIVWIVL